MTPEQEAAIKEAMQAAAIAEVQASMAQQPAPEQGADIANIAGQFGAGSQTGIAQMAGFPVDAITSGINGIGGLTGMWGPIEDPVGGSASIGRALAPFSAGVPEPVTSGQRVARRIGEEVGASAVTAPIAAAAAPGRMMAALGTEGASALGSGVAAAGANELMPGSAAAEIIAALAGGTVGGMAGARAFGTGGTDAVIRPGIEDQKMRAADAYGEVRADQRVLPPDSTFNLGLDVDYRMAQERINPRLQPGASAVRDAIVDDVMNPMRIEDMENLRRVAGQSLPVTSAPADQRLAGIMKDQITDYLDNLDDPVADALRTGRDAHRRAGAAQTVADASTKAARRAASTGSGGNEINAMRQNLRGIIDNPRKARSFTKPEREMMEQIVTGTGGQNAMRRLSRFAPSSGGLSAMLGVGGAMASPAVALPIMAITELAKQGGESSTRKVIDALMKSIAPDRVLSAGDRGLTPVIRALLAGRTIAGAE